MDKRVVLIAGATGNLGKAATAELAKIGYRMAWAARDDATMNVMQSTMPAGTEVLKLCGLDLTSEEGCHEAVAKTLHMFGKVDALVNTVGGFQMGPVSDGDIGMWDRMMGINARSAYLLSAAILPHMQAAQHGRIVHIAAAPGLKANSNQAAYAASKSAVIRLTEAIAAENRDSFITANCILPGTVDTPENRAAMPTADFGKWVAAQAIAKLIVYLVSPDAAVVTGAAIPATGRI